MNISDIVNQIIFYLTVKDKLIVLSISKFHHNLIKLISFDEKVYLRKIIGSPYFNKFTNIIVENQVYILNKITHLTFDDNFDQPIINIPNTVKYLTFGFYFNRSINNVIPNGVIHLIFGCKFNLIIRDTIPNSVTHLTFGCKFYVSKMDIIPNSVTHLTFGCSINESKKHYDKFYLMMNAIPDSVTHLTFGYYFNAIINNIIPNSITHLTFGYYFNQSIANSIPNSVTQRSAVRVRVSRTT